MGAKLLGVKIALPKTKLTNENLQNDFPDYSFDNFEKKVGIESRYVALEESTLDLAILASENVIKKYNIDKNSIDYILFCTQSPEYFLPTTACIIQDKLGLRTDIGAIDINLGCSAFPYAYNIASRLLDGILIKRVLLITSETYSRYIHPGDRANRAIFGDAASASIVDFENEDNYVFLHGTDGAGANNLIVRNGCRIPVNPSAELKSYGTDNYFTDNNLYMNGPEVFNFTINRIPSFFESVLKANRKDITTIDYVIFHQANKFMLDVLRKSCKIPSEKFLISLSETGNTVSNTIPIVLERLFRDINSQNSGKNLQVLILGFGVGLSWSGGILKIKV